MKKKDYVLSNTTHIPTREEFHRTFAGELNEYDFRPGSVLYMSEMAEKIQNVLILMNNVYGMTF